MINAVIVDDEFHARSLLESMLQKELGNELNLLGSCSNVQDAVALIKTNDVNLVFLDIQMPEENGFQLFNYIDDINFEVVFVTAFDQYAIKAFNCSALHYILKPLCPTKLQEALTRFKKISKDSSNLIERYEVLSEFLEQKSVKKRMAFNTTNGIEIVHFKDLAYLQADGNYCKFYFEDGSMKMVSKNLKFVESCLPKHQFYRVHRSTIVKLDAVKEYIQIDREVFLNNNMRVKVSERKEASFLNCLFENS